MGFSAFDIKKPIDIKLQYQWVELLLGDPKGKDDK
jgi:hypothetical protein